MKSAFHTEWSYVETPQQIHILERTTAVHDYTADHWWAEHFLLLESEESAAKEMAQRATIILNGKDGCNHALHYHTEPHTCK